MTIDNTKISLANLRVNYYSLLKGLQKAMYLTSTLPGPSHLKNLNQKRKVSSVFGMDLGLNNSIFSIGFEMFRI